jgi:hypothetical protein
MTPLQVAGIKQVNVTGTYPSGSRLTAPPTTFMTSTGLPRGPGAPYPPAFWQYVPHPSRSSPLAAAAVVEVGAGEAADEVLVPTGGRWELVDPPPQAANAATLIATTIVIRHRWRFT